jgi:hypothetical protein
VDGRDTLAGKCIHVCPRVHVCVPLAEGCTEARRVSSPATLRSATVQQRFAGLETAPSEGRRTRSQRGEIREPSVLNSCTPVRVFALGPSMLPSRTAPAARHKRHPISMYDKKPESANAAEGCRFGVLKRGMGLQACAIQLAPASIAQRGFPQRPTSV